MGEIVKIIANNPWTVICSLIIGILGIIFSVVFYIKSRKVKKPRATMRSINLLKNSISKLDGIKILYKNNDKPIPNLTVTKLAIWNAGNETINSSDIPEADRLLIKANDDVKILETQILFHKKESNQLDVKKVEEGKVLEITFDYLDYMEGGVIQILHTGNSTKDIDVSGTIKGVGKLKVESENERKRTILDKFIDKHSNIVKIIGIALVMFILIISTLLVFLITFSNVLLSDKIFYLLVFGSVTVGYSFSLYKLIKRPVPKGFEAFKDNM